MEDDFSIFHIGNFLPFHFHSILKIFHSLLKFSSIFHFILPYQGKFRPEATRNLYCTFEMQNVPLQVVAREGKEYGTMLSQTAKNILQKCLKKFKRKKKQRSKPIEDKKVNTNLCNDGRKSFATWQI